MGRRLSPGRRCLQRGTDERSVLCGGPDGSRAVQDGQRLQRLPVEYRQDLLGKAQELHLPEAELGQLLPALHRCPTRVLANEFPVRADGHDVRHRLYEVHTDLALQRPFHAGSGQYDQTLRHLHADFQRLRSGAVPVPRRQPQLLDRPEPMRLDDAVLVVATGHRSVAGCTRWLLPEARHLHLPDRTFRYVGMRRLRFESELHSPIDLELRSGRPRQRHLCVRAKALPVHVSTAKDEYRDRLLGATVLPERQLLR